MTHAALEIRALSAAYGLRVVLEDISLRLAAGEWYVLLGPNGSGKSTLLDCVTGRMRPSRGEVWIGGHSLGGAPFESKRQLGYGCAPETLPYLEEFVDTMSLGTRQKLSILLALVGNPALIVLDEAFNGLDPASALVVKRHLRARLERRGAALLLATHALDIVEHYADRAAVLFEGRLQREWQKAEIAELRLSGQNFESSLAKALKT